MPLSGDFTHFTLTETYVIGTQDDLAMLLPFLVQAHRDAPNDEWRSIVMDTHDSIRDASEASLEPGEPDENGRVMATFPKAAVAVMLQAVAFVDRLLTITEEEIQRVIASRDSDTSGTGDLS